MSQNKANLDAWHVLRTVVDAGGFAQAAQQLERSQSAVSYSVARLQEQIGLELLTIEGRKAVLTPQGATLLERGRALLGDYEEMLDVAAELRMGHEPGLLLWIDNHCTTGFLLPVLGEFQTLFPHTTVSVVQGLPDSTKVDDPYTVPSLAITTRALWDSVRINLGETTFIAVSHSNHPLQGHDRQLTASDLSGYRQVSLQPAKDQDNPHWQVSDVFQALGAILSGQGYGWLPEKIIEDELVKGSLLPLALEEGSQYRLPVYLQYNEQQTSSPNRRMLGELVKRYFSRSAV